jgi:hypothetical protein
MTGVCMWPGISYLTNHSPEFRRQYRTKVGFTDRTETALAGRFSDEEIAECKLLLHTAPGWADWGNEAHYTDLLARFPATTQRISFPYPVFPALWPMHSGESRNIWTTNPESIPLDDLPELIGETHYPQLSYSGIRHPWAGLMGSALATGPDGHPTSYPYGDAYVLGLIRDGVPKREIIERYRALDVPNEVDVDGILARNHQVALVKEASTDVKVAELIAERFATHRYFQTMNHPTNEFMIVMVDQALRMLGFQPLGDYPRQALFELLTIQTPIHPSLIRHFGLQYVDESTRYCVDEQYRRRLTFEEYFDQYIDFTSAPATDAELAPYHQVIREKASDAAALQAALAAFKGCVNAAIGLTCPAAVTADDMWTLAAGIADHAPRAEGWTTDFRFPGRADRPLEHAAGWLLFAVVNVFHDERPCGHLALSLVTGRRWSIFAQGGPYDVPQTWQPLARQVYGVPPASLR